MKPLLAWLLSDYARNVLLTMGSRAATMVAGIGSSILVARALGPSGRGEYYLVVTTAALIAQFGNLGLHSSNVYLTAKNPGASFPLAVNSLFVSVGVGLLTMLFLLALQIFGFLSGWEFSSITMVSALVATNLFMVLGPALLLGGNRVRAFNGVVVIQSATALILIALAAWLSLGVQGFIVAITSSSLLSSCVVTVLLLGERRSAIRFDLPLWSSGIRYATKAYLAALFGFLTLRINVYWLESLQGLEVLGYYSIATQIGDAIGLIPSSLAMVLLPRLVRNSVDRFRAMFHSLLFVALVMGVLCGIIAVSSDYLIVTVFGTEFQSASSMLRIVLISSFFLGMTGIISQYLAAVGIPVTLVLIWMVGFLCTALFGWFLAASSGGEGAAMALSVGHGTVFFLLFGLALVWRRREMQVQSSAPAVV